MKKRFENLDHNLVGFIGFAPCEYFLGNTSVWRVQEVFQENLRASRWDVVDVRCCCRCAHGIGRSPEVVIGAVCVEKGNGDGDEMWKFVMTDLAAAAALVTAKEC